MKAPRALITVVLIAGFATLSARTPARADPDLLVWRIAHEQMVAKWRRAEPRCGWTVGGYSCNGHRRVASNHRLPNKGY